MGAAVVAVGAVAVVTGVATAGVELDDEDAPHAAVRSPAAITTAVRRMFRFKAIL